MNPLCINDVDDLDMTCIWPKISILHEKRNLTHKKGKMKGDGQTFICNLEKNSLHIIYRNHLSKVWQNFWRSVSQPPHYIRKKNVGLKVQALPTFYGIF